MTRTHHDVFFILQTNLPVSSPDEEAAAAAAVVVPTTAQHEDDVLQV